ncbi:hypothetical protein ACHAXT_009313 [Thalassiosira profunda]
MDGVQKPAQDTSAESFELVNADELDLDARVKKLSEDISSMKNDMSVIKTLLEEDSKQKTLERALQLVKVGSFTYYKGSSTPYSSQSLAKEAIEHFLLGSGYRLPNWYMKKSPAIHVTTAQEIELDRRAFRLKVTEQVKLLIRRESRLVEHEDDGTLPSITNEKLYCRRRV